MRLETYKIAFNAKGLGAVSLVGSAFYKLLHAYSLESTLTGVFYELPQARSNVCADSQALIKLTLAAGTVHLASTLLGIEPEPVPIISWKGNMSKKVAEPAIREAAEKAGQPIGKVSEHELDAIGIGLFKLGLF